MESQEEHLRVLYDKGKRSAQGDQQAQEHPLHWEMEAIVEQRDAWERSAQNKTLSPDRRQVAAEFAARLDGWLSAWD